jgi:hypothetical protein
MKQQITINLKTFLKFLGIIVGVFLMLIIINFSTNLKGSDSVKYSTADLAPDILRTPAPSSKGNTNTSQITENTSYENLDDNQSNKLTEKKIIKNGNLSLKVKRTEDAVTEITTIAKNQTGEVFSTNFHERTKGQKSGSITIKVPVDKFETTLEEIKKIATQVLSESTTGQNVTEQYTDLEAQLKNKRAEEESFLKILNQAQEIEDILSVTKQISRVRGEIERLEGQLRFMDSQTDMSTIIIQVSEDVEISPAQNDWRPWEVTKKAFSDLIVRSQNFFDNTIRFIIIGIPSLIPTLIIVWIIYWVGKKVWKKLKK